MDVLDWVAVLGALAWLPHLFSLIRNWLTKPKIRVIAPQNVSVGFTTYGPIFNLHLAFSVRHKSIVVSLLKIKLLHESGEEKIFEWRGIQQELMKARVADGSVLPYQKENSILAMKLNEKDIEERFIQFQDPSFQTSRFKKEEALSKNIAYLREQGKYDPEEFIGNEDMDELYKYIEQEFSWKAGKYTVTIELTSPDKFVLVDNVHEFILTPLDVTELEKNKGGIRLDYKNMLVPQNPDDIENANWNWSNPNLHKIE